MLSNDWVDDFAEASFSLYAGNIVEGFQPLDFFHFFPLWYHLWMRRFMVVMDRLDLDHASYVELKPYLSTPSNMRSMLQKLFPTAKAVPPEDWPNFARAATFFARMLSECCPADPFGRSSTPLHTSKELAAIITTTPWQPANPAIARQFGQLITAAGSLVHGLYNDLVTDYGWDVYGPYSVAKDEDNYTLLIRHFPNLQVNELWPAPYLASVKELKMCALYQNVTWEIGCVGCHTIVKSGRPAEGLKQYAIIADGKPLSGQAVLLLINELAAKAESIYRVIRQKDFEALKLMVIRQMNFELNKLFTAAGIDWQPTPEMIAAIKNKPLATGVVPHGTLMNTLRQYKEAFGVNFFKEKVLPTMAR